MTAEQLSLLGDTPPVAPRCRMCVLPAHWNASQLKYSMYCKGNRCVSRERLCQHCGGPFTLGAEGAGTRYCSTDCKVDGYHPGGRRVIICAWCNAEAPQSLRRTFGGTGWPYICTSCLHPIRHVVTRLKDHHVPHERARRLMADPGCEVCGTDMLVLVRNSVHKMGSVLVVDHDHACCPANAHSCGKCVRGLICRACNVAAGHLYDSPVHARSLATYLEGWIARDGGAR